MDGQTRTLLQVWMLAGRIPLHSVLILILSSMQGLLGLLAYTFGVGGVGLFLHRTGSEGAC